jgi:hypothetical protein
MTRRDRRGSKETPSGGSVGDVAGNVRSVGSNRVAERRRAVALARHYPEFEGLSIRQIADRLARSPATVKAYFYDGLRLAKDLRIQCS